MRSSRSCRNVTQLALPLQLSQHPDQHRPKCSILLAVGQVLGERGIRPPVRASASASSTFDFIGGTRATTQVRSG